MSAGSPSSAGKWAAAILGIVSAACMCYAGFKHGLASYYASTSSAENWERATRIEPDNPELWYRLARYKHLDIDNADIPSAISDYRRAVQLNPRSPYYKLDLASALELSNNPSEADAEFRAAQTAFPISPEVSWRYGNFLLRQDRLPEAVVEIHRALMVDPTLASLAVSRLWHADPDVHLLIDQALPDDPAAYEQALSYLSDVGDTTAGLTVWNRLITKDPHADIKSAFKLIDLLTAQEKFAEAAAVWHQGTGAERSSELVYDGGLEKDISGGGFGWQQTATPGVDFDFDTDEKHSGMRAARLTFDGSENMNFDGLFQKILVSPKTQYHFQGFLHTDQISTNSGIRFEILDPKDARSLDILTQNVTGTEPWTLEQTDFTTGPSTHLVVLRVARRPSERLDNKIRGTAWIDDVSIVRSGASKSSEGK